MLPDWPATQQEACGSFESDAQRPFFWGVRGRCGRLTVSRYLTNIDSNWSEQVQHSLLARATGAPQVADAHLRILAADDILGTSKLMALAIPGTIGVFLIVIGSIFTIRKLKEGVAEALMFQIGLVVVGVVVVLSVGIAAGFSDFLVDQGVVDRKFYDGQVWGQ